MSNPVFAAIDPGTHKTGIALFDGTSLTGWDLITAPAAMPSYERISHIIGALADYIEQHPVEEFVCETATAMHHRHPAPELATLTRSIRSWATGRQKGQRRRHGWTEYHPSTIAASVSVRGLGADHGRKQRLRLGVNMLYADAIRITAPAREEITPEMAQDVYDAIALGHCHLTKLHTQGLARRA